MNTDHSLPDILSLYFVMGSQDAVSYAPLATLEMALKAGITCYQWREKGTGALTGAERLAFARQARALCRRYRVPFFVDDDVALAIELGADGVHVGQKDEEARTVREKIGTSMWLGVSAHSLDEAERARKAGADYIGVGPYKPTRSKADAESPIGTALIRALKKNNDPLPIVAIGGVTPDDVPTICSAGAEGIAVISAIAGAADPSQAVKRFLSALANVQPQ